MPRPNISDLKLPKDHAFHCTSAPVGTNGQTFDIKAACRAEDRFRLRSTALAIPEAVRLGLFTERAGRRLLKRLEYRHEPPPSLASSVWMRQFRNRLFSQIWRFAETYSGSVSTFTVIKRGLEYTPLQLLQVDVDKLLSGFLSDLNRRGAPGAEGWLIAFVHGEYETPAGIFRLHLHGIAAGEMIAIVDRLRKGAKYRSRRGDAVRFRVRISRQPLTNLPHSLAYCFKGYWPWKHVVITASGKRRTRRHKRIPEPYHALVLLFLDRRTAQELTVSKHLHVRRGRLVATAREARPC